MGILSNSKNATPSKTVRGVLFTEQPKSVSVQGDKRDAMLEQRMQPREKSTAGEVLWNEKLTPKFDTASMNLLAQNAVKPKATNPLIGAFEKQQTKKYGITPTDIRDDSLKKLSESELKSPITQFVSGAYEGSNIAKSTSAMQKLSGQKEPLIAKLARDTQPHQTGWRTAGKVFSGVLENAAMYGTVGKAAEGWKALEGIKSPFLQNLAGQQLADTVIQTPSVIMQGAADKKSIGGIAKDVGKQQAQDLGANLLFAGGEALLKGISKKTKAGKALAQQQVEDTARQAAAKANKGIEFIDPAAKEVREDGTKTLNDYFQARRTPPSSIDDAAKVADDVPLGGKLPKAVKEGIPLGEGPFELPEPAAKVNLKTDKVKSGKSLYTDIIDSQNSIAKMSKETGDKTATLASNSRNVGGTVDYILKDGLVDNKGNAVGESLQSVAKKIPKNKEQSFWDYMMQKGNIDRAREGKAIISNYTPEMSTEAVRLAEIANPEFKQIGEDVTGWIDKFMKTWGVDAGTVDETLYKQLRETYTSYVPTQREFSELEKSIHGGASRKFVDQSGPIKKAAGSDRNIKNPMENIMGLVDRTVKTAKYNEVGQELLQTVRTSPTKMAKFAEVIPTAEGMFSNVDNIVTVLEGGKPVYLKINDKGLLDAMQGLPKNINNLPGMRKVTGVFKSLITQKNPLFAVRNVARDMPTAYVYGSTANPYVFAKDYIGALKDVATDSSNFKTYRAIGGGGSNFFKQGSTVADDLIKGKNVLQKIGGAIEDVNNALETAPRLAEFNRTLRKTGDIDKALFAANDVTVNFARGGNLTKSAEPLVPYLNAGVQGLDKLFRTFKDPKTAVKALAAGGIGITTPTVALYMLNKDNPHYKELDNRTKDNYFLIPSTNKDKNGYSNTFIKIPKSRELGVMFGVLFERALRAKDGDNDAWKGLGGFKGTVATNFSPTNPLESNFFSPILNLKTNKDFADRNIVPQGMIMDRRSPYLQYDERTTEIAKKIGELSAKGGGDGLSPKQIDYLVRSYTGIIGQLGIPLATKGGDPIKAVTTQFISDPLYSSQTVTDFYDNYDKLQKKATDKNITEQLPTSGKQNIVTDEEKLRNQFAKVSAEISKINKEIKEIESAIISKKDKEKKVRELRQRIQDIAKEANESLK